MWHEHISKRHVRAPKICIRDSGPLPTLLAVHSRAELEAHPKVGAFKRTSAAAMTPSMRIALADLHLDQLYVVHGARTRSRCTNGRCRWLA